jgi:hypothetical protein
MIQRARLAECQKGGGYIFFFKWEQAFDKEKEKKMKMN